MFLPETKGRSLEEMSVYFAEITGDDTVLEAEAEIRRRQGDHPATEMVATTTVEDLPEGGGGEVI